MDSIGYFSQKQIFILLDILQVSRFETPMEIDAEIGWI
jgi:hypothetical protein